MQAILAARRGAGAVRLTGGAGGGRAIVNGRVTMGVDARMGWEPHVRINGVVGIRLGR